MAQGAWHHEGEHEGGLKMRLARVRVAREGDPEP